MKHYFFLAFATSAEVKMKKTFKNEESVEIKLNKNKNSCFN